MRIVVDTNIAFSAILNTNSRIAQILLHSKQRFNFYSTYQLILEIEEHKSKLKKIASYSDVELSTSISLVTSRIRFIDGRLIPPLAYQKAEILTANVDIDDTEFIALVDHLKGKFWSGDKELQKGLVAKGWNKFISTQYLFDHLK